MPRSNIVIHTMPRTADEVVKQREAIAFRSAGVNPYKTTPSAAGARADVWEDTTEPYTVTVAGFVAP